MNNYIAPEYRHIITNNLCSILNTAHDGFYITDREGNTLGLNKSYERLTGLKKEDLLGKNIKDLVACGTFDAVLNPEVVKTGKSAMRVQVNSENHKVLVTGHPVFDYDDDVVLVVTFVRDVTLMSKMEKQIRHQRKLINRYKEHSEKIASGKLAIAESQKMQDLLILLERVATTDATVLLLGETGVGKDVLARKLHESSCRADKPFFKVDCTSIPENLIESELFGYASGAFSGASTKGKPGFFEVAHEGTLFLDEIGELPLSMQGHLLRILQDGEICRVGDTKTRTIDVRIVAATNRNLEKEVALGNFRSDLYYRLFVAVVNVPSLRERKDDILPLARFFFDKFCQKYKKHLRFSASAEEALVQYNWPGNVRELENMVHSLVVTCVDGLIRVEDLPLTMHKTLSKLQNSPAKQAIHLEGKEKKATTADIHADVNWDNLLHGKSLKEITETIEKEVLRRGMQEHNSITSLAKALKTERSTLSRKLKRYNIINKK